MVKETPSPFDHYSEEEKTYISSLSVEDIQKMDYVSFMALLKEVNKPPGGISALLELIRLMDISENDVVLDVGSNTGYVAFEVLHLTNARKIYGLDISKDMVIAAQSVRELYPPKMKERILFVQGDIRDPPFPDEYFTKIVIGGSLAFVEGREKAIKGMYRILRMWGMVGDLEFYYRDSPPRCVLEEVNRVLGLTGKYRIKPWDDSFWVNLYENNGFEVIYTKKFDLNMYKSEAEIRRYCREMIARVPINEDAREAAYNKLFYYMSLFNENNRFLDAVMIIARKRAFKNQVHLFYK